MAHKPAFEKAFGRPVGRLRRASSAAAQAWCLVMHDEISWPMYGTYQCRRCLRSYRVPWDEPLFGRAPAAEKKAPPREVGAVRPVTA